MPAFVMMIGGLLVQIAGTLVGQVLLSIGIGFATYTGVSASLEWAKAEFISGFTSGSLPAGVVGLLALLKVGTCVSMLFSALTIRLTLSGLSAGGTLHRMVHKAPA